MNRGRESHEIDGLEGRLLVDGFRFAEPKIEAYFLTHFHGDHYGGLSSSFQGPGLIHCTSITARLISEVLGVEKKFVRAYNYGEYAEVCGTRVTFLDANHCPGAALLLFSFRSKTGEEKLHLHTGDMRYSPSMKEYPELIKARGRIDRIYLDTTYCHPKHVFPTQEESIGLIADSIIQRLNEDDGIDSSSEESKCNSCVGEIADVPVGASGSNESESQRESSAGNALPERRRRGRTLFLLSAYTIGKERVLLEVGSHM